MSRENPYESIEPFPCWDTCYSQRGHRWKVGERQVRGCTRVDLPDVKWEVDAARLRVHMGRQADPDLDPAPWGLRDGSRNSLDQPWWRTPGEEPSEGCPGGWIRSEIVESLMPYIRRRTEQGGRVQNMRLDQCDDRLVMDAVLYFEQCEERRIGYQQSLISQKMRSQHGG